MRRCENCGENHPESTRWWHVMKFWFNFAPREWGDAKRFAFAVGPYFLSRSARLRSWWNDLFVGQRIRLLQQEMERETAQEDVVIQLKYDDPRASALMMYLAEGLQKKEH
jgi:hypothetical protein